MTLGELKKILDATGYPVAYSHFTATPTNPVPAPPYICFLVDGSANLMADNKVYHKISRIVAMSFCEPRSCCVHLSS
ncbi:hypothetical protein PTB13_12210, partial [Bacillus sp. MHSD17]|nr:hypothetical protein [Bacillus sp. MHSD17]